MKALLLGDLSPTENTNPLFAQKDVETLFSDAAELFQGNDINFVNLECALTESDTAIKKFGPPLKAAAETADVLKMLGVTCCGLSNNHIFDFGIRGMKDTFAALDRVGLDYTGFGSNYADSRENYVVEKDGERVCIIAVCEHEYSYALEDRMGARPYDEYDTMLDIRKAKEENDRVLVLYHGGKEHCQYPSPRLHKLCRAMVDHGADVVLCQHSHCIGCYEEYHGGHILYGQGNFHFVKPFFSVGEAWNSSLAVQYDTRTNRIGFVLLDVHGETGIQIAKGEKRDAILSGFAKRNEELQNGKWKDGWHAFCESVEKHYKSVIGDACTPESTGQQNDHFGHYLDCEAHTDVWRELFKTYNHTNEKE